MENTFEPFDFLKHLEKTNNIRLFFTHLFGYDPEEPPIFEIVKNDIDIINAKRAVDSQIDKFKANWPGNELYLEVYEFEDGITVKRVNDPWGVPAAKRAFDSILNGYAK